MAAAVVALGLTVAGCGAGTSGTTHPYGNVLTIYTALPFEGPQAQLMESIEQGEELAIRQNGTIVGGHLIILQPEYDSSSSAGGWDPADAAAAAATATQNPDAIAYIGDFDSGATATSLPITNAAGLLQVSPASPYVGLTSTSSYDGKGEPGSYYASNSRTFARLIPSDVYEASAMVSFMHSLGVRSVYVLTDNVPNNTPFDSVIGAMAGADAAHGGVTLAGSAQIDSASETTPVQYASIVKAIRVAHAQAVVVAAAPDAGVEALWQELDKKLPGEDLFAPSTLATNPFLQSLGPAAANTYVTSPIMPLDRYGPQAQSVLALYRRVFRTQPTGWSLYGYEAMESVLLAITKAGKHAGDRQAVIKAYFHLGWRDSVIGRYRISNGGVTSQTRFFGYRVGYSVRTGDRLIEIRRHLGGS
jgi:branched-chain amino acid transport system substrate-binding protein